MMSDYQNAYDLGYATGGNPSLYDESQVGIMFIDAYQRGYHDVLDASGQGYGGPAISPWTPEQDQAAREQMEQTEKFVCWVVGCEREDPHLHDDKEPEVEGW